MLRQSKACRREGGGKEEENRIYSKRRCNWYIEGTLNGRMCEYVQQRHTAMLDKKYLGITLPR